MPIRTQHGHRSTQNDVGRGEGREREPYHDGQRPCLLCRRDRGERRGHVHEEAVLGHVRGIDANLRERSLHAEVAVLAGVQDGRRPRSVGGRGWLPSLWPDWGFRVWDREEQGHGGGCIGDRAARVAEPRDVHSGGRCREGRGDEGEREEGAARWHHRKHGLNVGQLGRTNFHNSGKALLTTEPEAVWGCFAVWGRDR